MYKTYYKPEHPRADITGYVANYILVAEAKLGRALEKGEVVHHKDFDKTNDDPDNLWIIQDRDHRRVPELQAKFLHQKGLYKEFEAWWEEHKDEVDEVQVLRRQLLQLEEKLQRNQNRIKKYGGTVE